jgi:hypothetical protein
MMQIIQPDRYSPSVFTPAPGSELYDYCIDRDLILIDSPEGYRRDFDSGAKIKGVDYGAVKRMVKESMRKGRITRKIGKVLNVIKRFAE